MPFITITAFKNETNQTCIGKSAFKCVLIRNKRISLKKRL